MAFPGCSDIFETAVDGAVPIGEAMRSLMYYESHREPERAVSTVARVVPGNAQQLLSVDYFEAQQVCPHGLEIANLMKRAVGRLA